MKTENYMDQGRWLLSSVLAYEDWPNKFWGIGNDSVETVEEDYSSRNAAASLSLEHHIGRNWWVVPLYDYADYDITETVPGGQLETGIITGSDGGRISGLGVVVRRDTRDDIYYPLDGSLLRILSSRFDSDLGSDFDFERYIVDPRGFIWRR